MENLGITYLAIPYTWNAELSFEIANKVAAKLMVEGYIVLSPVSHSHPISNELDLSLQFDQKFWMKQDLPLIGISTQIIFVVIKLDGERDFHEGFKRLFESSGCIREMQEAKRLDIPYTYLMYDEKKFK